MSYVSNRWLGGLLTNWNTVKKSIARLKKLEMMEQNESFELEAKTKKEQLGLKRELEKLRKTLSGIKDMATLPDILFVIDPKKEEIAVKEAQKLGLTVFAVVDTNCDPDIVDYAIPGNDDAIRAISLFLETMANAIIEGTGGQVEQPRFSDEFDVDALTYSMDYRGEYDEEGRFIMDDDSVYEAQYKAPITDEHLNEGSEASVGQVVSKEAEVANTETGDAIAENVPVENAETQSVEIENAETESVTTESVESKAEETEVPAEKQAEKASEETVQETNPENKQN
jgi:hypothetical protein